MAADKRLLVPHDDVDSWHDGDERASRLAQALLGARLAEQLDRNARLDASGRLYDVGHASHARVAGTAPHRALTLRGFGRWLQRDAQQVPAAPADDVNDAAGASPPAAGG